MARPLFNRFTLASERTRSRASMPSICEVKRYGAPVPQAGGGTVAPVEAELRFPGRLAPWSENPQEAALDGQAQDVHLKRLTYPVEYSLRPEDMVRVDGVPHSVVGLVPDRAYPIERHAILREEGGAHGAP